MEIDCNKTYAVIAGDIIDSSKLEKSLRENLLLIMKQGSEMLHSAYPEAIPFSVDVYAGDSWQLLVAEPNLALRAAVFYRAFLLDSTEKQADTRLVVSLGKVDFISRERISESDGEVFRNAGQLLKDTAGKRKMSFVASHDSRAKYWQCIFGLLDDIVSNWSAKQARAVSGAIRGLSLNEIASLWRPPVAHPTVAKHLDEAGWPAIQASVQLFESEWNPTCGL